MADFSDRLREVALTKEATRGTADGPDSGDFLYHQQHTIKPVVDKIYHNGVNGKISAVHGSAITNERTEGQIPFTLETNNMYLIGEAITGQDPVTTGANPYTHAYALATGSNIHNSFTVSYTDPTTGDQQAPNGMINTMTMSVTPDAYPLVTFEVIAGKSVADTHTPSYIASPSFFVPSQLVFKTAANYAGLGAASAIEITSLNLNVSKNAEGFMVNGSTEYSEIHNKDIDIRGDIELIYDTTTFRGYDLANTERAISIALSNGTHSITIELPVVSFEVWEDVSGENSIVRQRIAFIANDKDATNGFVKVSVVDNVASHA